VKLAVLYIRQSRHKDYEPTTSPQVQEEACRQLMVVQECDQVEVLRDLDMSGGKTAGRIGYLTMLDKINAGGVSVVAAFDQSRAFRNTTDALEFYALLEKRPQIEVAFVHGRFDRSPSGEFTYTTLAAAHAMERKMTAEKIRAAYRHRNSRGQATGMAPYGYRRLKEGLMVPDGHEAAVVRRILQEYATGRYSARALADRLNLDGIVKPGSRSGGLGWVPDTIIDVVRNVAYVGKTFSGSRGRRQGDLIPAAWPAIVDQEVFDAAQRQRERNYRGGGWTPSRARDYVFQGLLRCAHCGRPMRSKTNYSAFYYYCRNDVALGQQCLGARRGVREDHLLPWAQHLFERIDQLTPEGFEEAVENLNKVRQPPTALADIDRMLVRQQQLFTWGHISESEYLREHERLTTLRHELMLGTVAEPVIEIESILDAWNSGDIAIQRQLLSTLFDGLVVRDGEVIEYIPRKDRAVDVHALITAALDDAEEVVEVAPSVRSAENHGAKDQEHPSVSSGGKGGIRTLEGALHPLPA
jgi:site-specific DNA recombinase